MQQLTKEQAIAFYQSGAWEALDLMERARFQLEQRKLCMPFEKFHEAIEHALGRPVWTHEFAKIDRLKDELYERKPKATLEESINLIPAEKRIILQGPS